MSTWPPSVPKNLIKNSSFFNCLRGIALRNGRAGGYAYKFIYYSLITSYSSSFGHMNNSISSTLPYPSLHTASDVLNLNVTSTLIDLYRQTSGNWTADYRSQQEGPRSPHDSPDSPDPPSTSGKELSQHKRSPFIPYVIRNDSGSNLWFLTATTTPSK